MAEVNGCLVPEDLLYHVDPDSNSFTWVRDNGDGTYTIGLTSIAAAMAGRLVAYTPKKIGKTVKKGKSVATIESGKWVGPVPAPFEGEITEVNEDLKSNPALVNDDPYGGGWIVKLKPTNPQDIEQLLKGAEAVEALRKVAEERGVKCA